jgi:hypothetical protein
VRFEARRRFRFFRAHVPNHSLFVSAGRRVLLP